MGGTTPRLACLERLHDLRQSRVFVHYLTRHPTLGIDRGEIDTRIVLPRLALSGAQERVGEAQEQDQRGTRKGRP